MNIQIIYNGTKNKKLLQNFLDKNKNNKIKFNVKTRLTKNKETTHYWFLSDIVVLYEKIFTINQNEKFDMIYLPFSHHDEKEEIIITDFLFDLDILDYKFNITDCFVLSKEIVKKYKIKNNIDILSNLDKQTFILYNHNICYLDFIDYYRYNFNSIEKIIDNLSYNDIINKRNLKRYFKQNEKYINKKVNFNNTKDIILLTMNDINGINRITESLYNYYTKLGYNVIKKELYKLDINDIKQKTIIFNLIYTNVTDIPKILEIYNNENILLINWFQVNPFSAQKYELFLLFSQYYSDYLFLTTLHKQQLLDNYSFYLDEWFIKEHIYEVENHFLLMKNNNSFKNRTYKNKYKSNLSLYYIGRLDSSDKNLKELIIYIQKFREETKLNLQLQLFGTSLCHNYDYENEEELFLNSDFIHYNGYVLFENIDFSNCLAVVLNSINEGQSTIMRECFYNKIPFINKYQNYYFYNSSTNYNDYTQFKKILLNLYKKDYTEFHIQNNKSKLFNEKWFYYNLEHIMYEIGISKR